MLTTITVSKNDSAGYTRPTGMYYLVRLGPPPSEMMVDGIYDVKFTDFCYFSGEAISAMQDLLTNDQHDDKLVLVVEQIWLKAIKFGFGHILVGTCDQFEWEGEVGNKEVVKDFERLNPKNYRRLFAVASTGRVTPVEGRDAEGNLVSAEYAHIDIALDYREELPKPEIWAMRKAVRPPADGPPADGPPADGPPADSPTSPDTPDKS